MDNLSVLKKIEQQYENNLPFVLYSYPKKESVNFILQKDNLVYDTAVSYTKLSFCKIKFTLSFLGYE